MMGDGAGMVPGKQVMARKHVERISVRGLGSRPAEWGDSQPNTQDAPDRCDGAKATATIG